MSEERIIKSKKRVQIHGEVFTPKRIVNKMLDTPGIKEETQRIESRFLEPSAGEGAFLVEILKRKLDFVRKNYNESLAQYENYSLFALSTIYGIELLDDNLATCILNMYDVYRDKYAQVLDEYGKQAKTKVLESAKLIIKTNIVQGDFLKRTNDNGRDIIFSCWEPLGELGKNIRIQVSRTEYSLNEIVEKKVKGKGDYLNPATINSLLNTNQITMFNNGGEEKTIYKFVDCNICDVYMKMMEEEDA